MTARNIVTQLEARGHELSITDGRIRLVWSGSPAADKEMAQLRELKSEVIAFLVKREEELASAMTGAIHFLANLCPVDLNDCLDRRLLKERQRLNRLPLRNATEIQVWREGWRILFAELAIDKANSI